MEKYESKLTVDASKCSGSIDARARNPSGDGEVVEVIESNLGGGGGCLPRFVLCFNRPCRSIKSFRTKDTPQIAQVNGFSPVSYEN